MKVLMVAPKICTPWSEGRKKFFLDLSNASSNIWNLTCLTTIDQGETTTLPGKVYSYEITNSRQHLTKIFMHLEKVISTTRPELVCHMPFGVFSGLRGIANLWIIWWVEHICKKHNIPCQTLMYSLTSEANTMLHDAVLKSAYFNQYSQKKRTVRFGVSFPTSIAADRQTRESNKKILFLAGMAELTTERLEYALNVRGLKILLKAGNVLQKKGYQLIVAIPLLKNNKLKKLLQNNLNNTWDEQNIEFFDQVSVPEIFLESSIFAFPYAKEETQFIPTSILEAMHNGVPVVMPRLEFLSPIHNKNIAFVYEPNNTESLIDAILKTEEKAEVALKTEKARAFVKNEYSIESTIKDIEKNLIEDTS